MLSLTLKAILVYVTHMFVYCAVVVTARDTSTWLKESTISLLSDFQRRLHLTGSELHTTATEGILETECFYTVGSWVVCSLCLCVHSLAYYEASLFKKAADDAARCMRYNPYDVIGK